MAESIQVSAWLGCNVDQAFDMFTHKEHLMSWLPIVENIEPREGGKYEISWAMGKPSFGCKLLIYEPNKYFMFAWKGSADRSFMYTSLLDAQVTIYFLPMDIEQNSKEQFTEVRLSLTSFNDLDNHKRIKIWFAYSLANAFEKLVEHVNDVIQ